MKLTLDNFSVMNPETPQYSKKNSNYLISGVDPAYYLQQNAIEEQKAAPLAAARMMVSLSYSMPSRTLQAIPSLVSTFDTMTANIDGHIYGVGATITDYGFLAPANDAGIRVNIFAGKVFGIYSSFSGAGIPTTIYYKSITTPAAGFSQIVGALHDGSGGLGTGTRYMCNFLDFMAVSDNDGSANNSNRIVRKVDSSLVVSKALDLGVGWNISNLVNYNNRFLAITANYSGDSTPQGDSNYADTNFLFLWDGISPRYNTSIRIPGRYVDLKLVGDVLYLVSLERNNQYALYELSGSKFKEVFPIAVDFVFGNYLAQTTGNVLFNYNNNVGINLFSKGQYIYDPQTGSKYILTPQSQEVCVRAGTNGTLYGFSGTTVSTYSTGYSPILYRSQWLPVENVKNIVVKYATPPQGVGDTIQVTLDGYDEDGAASATLSLQAPLSITTTKRPLIVRAFKASS
jgi:hypothetical protein